MILNQIKKISKTVGDDVEQIRLRGLMATRYFPEPISKEQTKRILRRALELLEDRSAKRARLNCRRENIDQNAKNISRFLTGAVESEAPSIASSQATEVSEFCERDVIVDRTERRVSQKTMEYIIRLKDQGQSEQAIRILLV